MLYLALIVSAILLLVVNLIAYKAEHPRSLIGGVSIILGGACVGFLCVVLPPVIFQAIGVGGIVAAWGGRRWRPAVFLLLSFGATFLVYGILGYLAYRQTRELQQEYAYVSLEDRLPTWTPHRSGASVTPIAPERLGTLESHVESECRMGDLRMTSLQRLHEETVSVFVNRPGSALGE
jgi:hypothetical protein